MSASFSSPPSSDPVDIRPDSWVDRWLPAGWQPYAHLARLDRPIGWWLLLLPCWWGIALAAERWPNPVLMGMFLLGAIVMRGAGCTINDIWDRDIDRQVARTRTRPLVSGAVSLWQALAFLAGLLALGALVLLVLNRTAVIVSLAVMGLVVVYPAMKRITDWPQLVLGLTFNWGALVGWTAVRGELDAAAFALYGAGIFWTLGYDTLYAHQDKADDARIGVRSTALLFGRSTRIWVAAFYVLVVLGLGTAGWLTDIGWPFYAGLALGASHLTWQLWGVDLDRPGSCLGRFKSNRDFGLIITLAVIAGRLAG